METFQTTKSALNLLIPKLPTSSYLYLKLTKYHKPLQGYHKPIDPLSPFTHTVSNSAKRQRKTSVPVSVSERAILFIKNRHVI